MYNKYTRKDRPLTIADVTKSKMVKSRNAPPLFNPMSAIQRVSQKRASVAIDAKAIREVNPEVKIIENLIIDTILSANDLTTIEPKWKLDNSKFSNSTVVTKVLDVIRDHFVVTHKINPRLKRYLKNILFDHGSQTLIVIPENSIDELINRNVSKASGFGIESFVEDLKKNPVLDGDNIGLLGNGLDFVTVQTKTTAGPGIGIESFVTRYANTSFSKKPEYNALSYCVHDNPNILKLAEIRKKITPYLEQQRLRSVGLETFGFFNSPLNGEHGSGSFTNKINLTSPAERKELNKLYKNKQANFTEFTSLEPQSQLSRKTVGHPIQFEPNSESVIPITVAGSPDEKMGVILLLGDDGNPINIGNEINRWSTLESNFDSSQTSEDSEATASNVLKNTYMKMYGQDLGKQDKQSIAQLNELYTQLVVDDLNKRMVNGVYGKTVTIAAHENIFKVMLARHLSNMNTRLLYIPEPMVTYMAFNYNEDGTGRALTEDVRIIASYRSMVTMATVLAQIKSSINRTKIKITLDEDDMEGDDAVRMALEEFAKNQAPLPFGNTSYHQQYSFFQQSGLSVEVDGNENFIDMKLETDISQQRYESPDNDLSERLRKDLFSGYGVTTEHIDQVLTSDTATAVKAATSNFTKVVRGYRHTFNHFMSQHSQKYIANSQPLRDDIKKILVDYKDELPPEMAVYFKDNNNNIDLAINDLIREIVFELPDEGINLTDAHVESFEKFSNFIDLWIDTNINTDFLTAAGLGDKGAEYVDLLKSSTKAILLRQFLQDSGFGSRFDELIFGTEEEATLDKIANNHITAISKIIANFSKLLNENKEKLDKNLEEMDELENTETPDEEEDLSNDSIDEASVDEENIEEENPEGEDPEDTEMLEE